MPSLNIALNVLQNPKVKRLRRELGKEGFTHLISLWLFAGNFYGDDGVLAGQTVDDIEDEAGWRGEKGKMVAAMVKCALLDQIGDFYAIHDWSEHEGHFLRYKKQGKKAAKSRWDNDKEQKGWGAVNDAASIPDASMHDAASMPDASMHDAASIPDASMTSCISDAPAAAVHAGQCIAAAVHASQPAAGDKEKENTQALRAELSRAGISGKNLDQLSALPLYPIDVLSVILIAKTKSDLEKPVGWIVTELREVALRVGRTIAPEIVTAMINGGAVKSFNGKNVVTTAGHNSGGVLLMLDDQNCTIAPRELKPSAFMLYPIAERPRIPRPRVADSANASNGNGQHGPRVTGAPQRTRVREDN
jgi:hypothetical protein